MRHGTRLSSVIDPPKLVAYEIERYKDVYARSAAYLGNIIDVHPFTDGNKRTAVTACGVFLSRGECALTASPKLLEDFTVKVTTDYLIISEIASWLKQNT